MVSDGFVSPCTSVCRLDPATRICEGCNRTQMEIFMWTKYTHEERMSVMKRLGYGKRGQRDRNPR